MIIKLPGEVSYINSWLGEIVVVNRPEDMYSPTDCAPALNKHKNYVYINSLAPLLLNVAALGQR
jgi:hypothetical protein